MNEITEKQRRVYYQDIVYKVCSFIDSKIGGSTVCGTAGNPSSEVVDRLAQAWREAVLIVETDPEWDVVPPAEPEKQPQHTPGPWGVEQTQTTNWIGPLRADGKVDRIVAHNDRHGLRPEVLAEVDADARLIAQAPSMESTIEECLKQRDEAEAAADELTSLVLNEPVDWAFHNEAWQRAVQHLKDAKCEPDCTLPTASPHEGCHVVHADKHPQPGEWWLWASGDRVFIMWCSGLAPDGMLVWHEDENGFDTDDQWHGRPIRHLPDCTGFDYEVPPEETPAEKRLRKVGIRLDSDGDYWTPQGFFADVDAYTPDQLEAIAAHMREREGGESDA